MRLLLDTHALLWALDGNARLSSAARAAIGDSDNVLLISSVSAFEITTKFRIGKLPEFAAIDRDFPAILADLAYEPLSLRLDHAALAGAIDHAHGDPFDRLLAAQALDGGLAIVSADPIFRRYGVRRVW